MREQLNNNPVAQVGLVLVLVAVAAFMFLKPGGGGGEEEAATEATVSVGGTEMSQQEVASTAGEVVEGAVETAIESGALAGASGSAAMPTSVPAPPPPREFSAAYDSGKTVVLLVVHDGGIDDRLTATAASALTAMPEVALIKAPVKQLPRYAAVTVGLDLNRVPAVVVMKPKRLSGGIPQATVDYGFQTPETLVQAVRDASYHGPEATYPGVAAMSGDEGLRHPSHLRPVPDAGATAPALDPGQGGTPGLTPPVLQRGYSRGFITDVLVELGYATPEAVGAATETARTAGRPPEALLLEQGTISEDQLSRATAERYGLDHLDLSLYNVNLTAAALFPVTMARRYRAVPVGFLDQRTLLVAAADPANVLAADDIQIATGLDCRIAVAAPGDVDALLTRVGTLQSAAAEAIIEDEDQSEEDTGLAAVSEMQAGAEDAPVIKLVYSILAQAVGEGASDIHLEPEEGELRVRFRIDGVLKEAAHVPKRMIGAVISRLKIMSELDIAEKRVPQDGRVSVAVDERRIDLRVTTLPTQRGEGATIRILDESNAQRSLDELGMDGSARARFENAFRQAYGAILVTGPTGSGKSTTLYAALTELNEIEKKIITIEDPVEYRIDGINQMNVNRKAGLDFARGLRSILRADPDIVMVGEIRDAETARIAIEAALTGHMMLTTLHTNDAPGAIARLGEMGIEPFLTASAVDCVVAQRLARKLCPHCKRRTVIPTLALLEAGVRVGAEVEAYEPVGCARCNQSGYRGRVGIFSAMELSDQLKEMTIARAAETDIAAVAREEGMLTLREDGVAKIRSGQTSLEEVLRVTA